MHNTSTSTPAHPHSERSCISARSPVHPNASHPLLAGVRRSATHSGQPGLSYSPPLHSAPVKVVFLSFINIPPANRPGLLFRSLPPQTTANSPLKPSNTSTHPTATPSHTIFHSHNPLFPPRCSRREVRPYLPAFRPPHPLRRTVVPSRDLHRAHEPALEVTLSIQARSPI